MLGLSGTRVILLDDTEKEALPIIKAFSKYGVPVAYFDGTVESLPEKPMIGVRLAILDMDLVGGISDKTRITALINTLGRILSPENGPFIALAWTKHVELINLFQQYILSSKSLPKPVCTMMITKTDYIDDEGRIGNLDALQAKIKEELSKQSPLEIMGLWEEQCFTSASQVTSSLCNLSPIPNNTIKEWQTGWKKNLLETIKILAKAEAGKSMESKYCINAFLNALNPLLADKMENSTQNLCASLNGYDKEIMASNISNFDITAKAKLNSMLHLSLEDSGRFGGGTIYTFSSSSLPSWLPDKKEIIRDFYITAGKEEDIKEDDSGKKKKLEEAENLIKHIDKLSKLVIMEVNASCDHAQNKVRVARFIAGILFSNREASEGKLKFDKKSKRADFMKEMNPVFIRRSKIKKAEACTMIFSSLHLITADLGTVKRYQPMGRLRSQAFVDFQAWLGHQIIRPGMLFILPNLK